jgi:hypothetical protein
MAIDMKRDEDPDLRSEEECFPVVNHGVEVVGDDHDDHSWRLAQIGFLASSCAAN